MQKRKSHNKSRNGCTNCKKRHVKCDERGIPCANCVVRDSADTCSYGPNSKQSPARDSDSSRSNSNDHLKVSSPNSSVTSFDLDPNRRLVELQLMHQWSVSTYKSLCSTQYDQDTMQIQMPKWSLKHDFLLNGVFAIAALEIAMVDSCDDPVKSAKYTQLAMEYYDRGSADFRSQLSDITQENSTELYMFSSLAWIISMSIPFDHYSQEEKSILERTTMLMELVMGSSLIAFRSVAWIMSGPLSASMSHVLASFMEPDTPESLDADSQNAFANLAMVAEKAPPSHFFPAEASRNAIVQLRLCYREEMNGRILGSAMAFPSLAGQGYPAAIRNSEAVALLILMYWAVMIDKLDRVDKMWWAKSVGRSLVEEISDRLLGDQSIMASMTEFWQAVAWAREKVGLPAFAALDM